MTFNMTAQQLADKLGITLGMAERMIKSAKGEEKKETKKKGGWHPGMPSNSSKVDVEVTVTTICQCCGDKKVELKTINQKKDSPTTMLLGVSVCEKCPEYIAELSHQELVSLVLIMEQPLLSHELSTMRSRVRAARRLTPLEVISFTAGDSLADK